MPVAKSFTSFEILGEPFEKNGRPYVKVRNPQTNTIREVRWYTETEYKKLYPDIPSIVEKTQEVKKENALSLKKVLGFEKGYITIFKGNIEQHEEWFRNSIARYSTWWGWYIISTDELPEDIPFSIAPVRLNWERVSYKDGRLKPEAQVKEEVEKILYSDIESTSEYQGNIGDRLEIKLTVSKVVDLENDFNQTHLHVMEDEKGNVYIWSTSSKRWEENTTKMVRGTVKAHKLYKGVRQTVLTRCLERNIPST